MLWVRRPERSEGSQPTGSMPSSLLRTGFSILVAGRRHAMRHAVKELTWRVDTTLLVRSFTPFRMSFRAALRKTERRGSAPRKLARLVTPSHTDRRPAVSLSVSPKGLILAVARKTIFV